MATQLERRAGDVGFEEFTTPETWQRRQETGDGRRRAEESSEQRLARGLGWFSIGLGLAQIGAPRAVARLIGVAGDDETRNTMFAIGLREIASGLGILSRPNPAPFLWSRVGGDVMDLALLGRELNSEGAERPRVAAATAAVLGVTLLDLYTSQQFSRRPNGAAVGTQQERGVLVKEAVTVKTTPEAAYSFWRDFQNLPRFMSHLASVRATGPNRLHWNAEGPAGLKFEWEAEIMDDRPNELIAWRSVPGGDIESSGSVEFRRAPGDRGTEVIMELRYQPPGGRLVAKLAKFLGKALEVQVERDLRTFKQIMEVGEVVHSDASIHQRPHAARPSTKETHAQEPHGVGRIEL
jgi:uncharacterized membrane protein